MRVVIANQELDAYAGTETYVLTIAVELQRLGHEVTLLATRLGPVAEEARSRGIAVVAEEERLPDGCDVVLPQDAGMAFLMAARYPEARRVFVAHSSFHALQSPPQLDGVCDAVVVMGERTARFVESLALHPPLVRLNQPIDLVRFGHRRPNQGPRRRALLLGNYLRGPLVEVVEGACRAAGFEPVQAGTMSTSTASAEVAIADAEVVIGLGRCILEAMASSRAAYVYGLTGGDGWVTPGRYTAMAADGFGGEAFDDLLIPERITADLRAWDAGMGPANRLLATRHHGVEQHVRELLTVVAELKPGPVAPPTQAGELARLVRLQWSTWADYIGALEERRRLRDAVEQERGEAAKQHEAAREAGEALATQWAARAAAEASLVDLTAERDAAVAALDAARAALERATGREVAFRATRRFRVARLLGAPADAVRRRRRGSAQVPTPERE